MLRQIEGNHIVKFLDVKRTPNNLYIITEYCNGKDLEHKIKQKHQFTEEEGCSIIKQIADAFLAVENSSVVNSKGQKVTIMHRDIKPANILFHDGIIKVADFGFAKLVEDVEKDNKKNHTPNIGTPLFMSPELLNEEDYSTKCDIWSTGMLFYQLLFGKLPWTAFSIPRLYKNIKEKPLEFPSEIKEETKNLIKSMLKVNDKERITWKEVFEHPALKKIDISLEAMSRQLPKQYMEESKLPEENAGSMIKEGPFVPAKPSENNAKSSESPNNDRINFKSPLVLGALALIVVLLITKLIELKNKDKK